MDVEGGFAALLDWPKFGCEVNPREEAFAAPFTLDALNEESSPRPLGPVAVPASVPELVTLLATPGVLKFLWDVAAALILLFIAGLSRRISPLKPS